MSNPETKFTLVPELDANDLRLTMPRKKPTDDAGESLLPHMEHFVTLSRRVKQPLRLLHLVERIGLNQVPQIVQDCAKTAKAALPAPVRRQFYEWLANQPKELQIRLNKCCDRIQALRDDFGIQAVMSQLDKKNEDDAAALAEPSDRFTRALYLFMQQEFPTPDREQDRRFELAEWRQSINHQWSNQDYASHFLGPKDAQPRTDSEVAEQLKTMISELFEEVDAADILIQFFHNQDKSHTSRHDGSVDEPNAPQMRQHTITATFNGTMAFYKKVEAAEVIEKEEIAALDIVFSWEPESGMLGVFCKEKSVRSQLATLFQKVVLASDVAVTGLPMCSFDLKEFGSSSILQKISNSTIPGVQSISIQKIRLSHQLSEVNGATTQPSEAKRKICSHQEIWRDRRDQRNIYEIAQNDFKIQSLDGDDISKVNLCFSIAKQAHRKAHNIAVQITSPNGLSSRCKTSEDVLLMRQQLIKLGIMTEVAAT